MVEHILYIFLHYYYFSCCMQFIMHIFNSVPFLLLFLWSLNLASTSSLQLCKSCPSFKTWGPDSHYKAFLSCAFFIDLPLHSNPFIILYSYVLFLYRRSCVERVIHFSTLEEALPADVNWLPLFTTRKSSGCGFILFILFPLGFTPKGWLYVFIHYKYCI